MNKPFDRETLLRLAREDGPTPEQLSRIGDRLSTSVVSGATAPAIGGSTWVTKILLAMVVAVPAAAVVLSSSPDDELERVAAPTVTLSRPVSRGVPVTPAATEPTRDAAVMPPAPVDPPERAFPEAPPARAARVRTKPAREDPQPAEEVDATAAHLAAEAKLLREAAAALRDEDIPRSKQLLLEHERRFPAGSLNHERRVLRVKLLCLRGSTGRAAEEAKRMLAQGIPARAAAQLRASCAGAALKDPISDP